MMIKKPKNKSEYKANIGFSKNQINKGNFYKNGQDFLEKD